MKFNTKNIFVYLIGLVLLGVGITFLLKSMLGASSWDALLANLVDLTNTSFKIIQPLLALFLLPLAYLMQKKKFSYIMIFPILVSVFIGMVVDIFISIIPQSSSSLMKYIYFFVSLNLFGISLNLIIYPKYPISAIDEFTIGIQNVYETSFGKARVIGEFAAIFMAIIIGRLGKLEFYNIGIATIIFAVLVGVSIDFYKPKIDKLLK